MKNNKPHWEIVLVAVLSTLAGIAVGKFVGSQGADTHTKDSEGAADHGGSALNATTLANLGVEVGPVAVGSFQRPISMAAHVVDTPSTVQPVYAPIGGRVATVEVEKGGVVDAGSTVITLVRESLPRPTLTFTADVLRPAQELLHEQALELRKSAEEVSITSTELERLGQFTGEVGGEDLPIIPRERAIDMQYQLMRAQKVNELARLELAKHGLSEEQIDSIEAGAPLPAFDEAMWQRALARNGLWPVEAQRLSEILPEDLRRLPWVTATIGELAASGLVSEALTMWLAEDGVGQRFLDIGVLLQRGHSVEDLQRLHELNALDPVVHVTAPLRPGATDWDVVDVAVKPGMVLEPGEPLLTLRDSSYLWLQVSPVGGEVTTLLAAAQENRTLVARPLVPGAGPTLTGVTLRSLESDKAHGGTLATVRVKNAVHSGFERDGGRSRVWQLRAGLRYVLEVPVQTLDDVFILPTSAVAESGPERVVFLQDGDGFKPVPIVVLYENDQVVVVPKSKHVQLYDGDVIARTGAFELGLALTSGDGVDAHAGHNH